MSKRRIKSYKSEGSRHYVFISLQCGSVLEMKRNEHSLRIWKAKRRDF
jgi:hypothetical protein